MARLVQDETQGAVAAFDVVHARVLQTFPELVADLGGDLDALLQQAGLGRGALAGKTQDLAYRQIVQLVELAADALSCPDFGMRLAGRQSGVQMFGPLGLAMKNSRTFGEALEYVVGHSWAHSPAARIWLRRTRRGDMVFVGHDILLDRVPAKCQAMEQILLGGHLAAQEITGGQARVRRVHFRHQPVSPLALYRRNFGCEVRFGQHEDGVFFADSDLAAAIVDPDAGALAAVTAFIDAEMKRQSPPLHAMARGIVMHLIGRDVCTNERVAAELGLHPRTLHRRLHAEGTSFQKIKDEVRQDFLLYYLQRTDLDLARISERLGFAEQSVMTRSCNRWFAACPSQVRARGGGALSQ